MDIDLNILDGVVAASAKLLTVILEIVEVAGGSEMECRDDEEVVISCVRLVGCRDGQREISYGRVDKVDS